MATGHVSENTIVDAFFLYFFGKLLAHFVFPIFGLATFKLLFLLLCQKVKMAFLVKISIHSERNQ